MVNDQEAEITQSPQDVMLEIAEGDVVIEAFFSEDPTCNTILQTGVTLEACEQDCEGVFDGDALPDSPCVDLGDHRIIKKKKKIKRNKKKKIN